MNENAYNDDLEIDLLEFAIYLFKKSKNIFIITLICVLISIFYSYFIKYNLVQRENKINQETIERHMVYYQEKLDKTKQQANENYKDSINSFNNSLDKYDYFSKANILISPADNNLEYINNICNTFSYMTTDNNLLTQVLSSEEYSKIKFDEFIKTFSVYTVPNSSLITVKKLYNSGDGIEIYNQLIIDFAQRLANEINSIHGGGTATVQATPTKQIYTIEYTQENKATLAEYEKIYNTAVANAQNTYNTEISKFLSSSQKIKIDDETELLATAPVINETSASTMAFKTSLVTSFAVVIISIIAYFVYFCFGDSLNKVQKKVLYSLK